jgi:L-ascorbate metabolism protein UlaG (beta-lactamase superfamily)
VRRRLHDGTFGASSHTAAAIYPDIDLCLIHLGGTRIAGVLLTMNAAQGVRALQIVQPRTAIPIHTDDYTVFKSPLSEFRSAVDAASHQLASRIQYVDRGETWQFLLAS